MKNNKKYINLNIYPTKSKCRIIFFRQNQSSIEIISEIEKNIIMDNRVFLEKSVKDNYVNEISSCISNEILKLGKCKSVFINLQEEDIILKNIKIDPYIKKKDLIKAANIEIKEICNRPLSDYYINYKLLSINEDYTEVQVILFPKKYVSLFSLICDRIDIEDRTLHTNFDILERLIKKMGVKIMDEKDFMDIDGELQAGIVEFRDDDLVITIFENQAVKSSYVIKKDEFTDEMAISIFSNCCGIIGIGNREIEDIKLIQRICEISEADFEKDVDFIKNNKSVSFKEYFNIAGKRIN